MLGDEAVTAGVAGPEIRDDMIAEIRGRFRGDHGIRANRAGRQITSARVRLRRDNRQDFSDGWHRDLLCVLNREPYSRRKYKLKSLTMSQHKCVGFALFGEFWILHCSEFLTAAFPLARRHALHLIRQ